MTDFTEKMLRNQPISAPNIDVIKKLIVMILVDNPIMMLDTLWIIDFIEYGLLYKIDNNRIGQYMINVDLIRNAIPNINALITNQYHFGSL